MPTGLACSHERAKSALTKLWRRQAGKVEIALKSGFLKTDADLQQEEGMAECLKIRKEVARRFVCSSVGVCVREKEREGANCQPRTSENRAGCARVVS